jgi:hypothetical protein
MIVICFFIVWVYLVEIYCLFACPKFVKEEQRQEHDYWSFHWFGFVGYSLKYMQRGSLYGHPFVIIVS